MILLADSGGPDQTARIRRLIWAFAVRICPKARLCMALPISCCSSLTVIRTYLVCIRTGITEHLFDDLVNGRAVTADWSYGSEYQEYPNDSIPLGSLCRSYIDCAWDKCPKTGPESVKSQLNGYNGFYIRTGTQYLLQDCISAKRRLWSACTSAQSD